MDRTTEERISALGERLVAEASPVVELGGILQGGQGDPGYLRARLEAAREQLRACDEVVGELEGLLG